MTRQKVVIGITQANFGGAQRYVYDLATSLPSDQYDILVVAGGGGILTDKLAKASVRTSILADLARSIRPAGDFSTLIRLYKLLRTERPDILHTNSSKMGLLGGIAGRLAGVPHIVFTAHGWAFNAPVSRVTRSVLYALSMLIITLSDRTIAVSKAVASHIAPSLRSRCIVVHNGIPEMTFASREDARTGLKTRGAIPEGFWLGTIAELHPVKGHVFAIEAFARIAPEFPEAQYLIIGEGSEHKHITHIIKQKGLEGRVHVVGFMDARATLKALDAFVLPSLSEGLSYAVLEAGAAGVPIIASAVGGIPEIITDGTTGLLVRPRDSAALANAFARIMRDSGLRERLAHAAATHIRSSFSIEHMLRGVRDAYRAR